jgi:hypothetical protein
VGGEWVDEGLWGVWNEICEVGCCKDVKELVMGYLKGLQVEKPNPLVSD